MLDRQDLQAIAELIDAKLAKQSEWFDAKLAEQSERFDAKLAEQSERFDAKLNRAVQEMETRLDAHTRRLDTKMDTQSEELKSFVREEIRRTIKENNLSIAEIVTETGEKITANLTEKIGKLEQSIQDMEAVTAQNAYDIQLFKIRKKA